MAQKIAKVHDKTGEALAIGRVVCIANKLATHIRPDLNAILSIWICQRIRRHAGISPAEVMFIPASTTHVDKGVFAVDIGHGRGLSHCGVGRAIKRSAIKGSSSMALYRALPDEDREALEPLVRAISEADEHGDNVHTLLLKEEVNGSRKWDNIQLRDEVLATTMWSVYHNLYNVMEDLSLLIMWSTVFDGLLVSETKKKEAFHASMVAEYRYGNTLAILPHGAPPESSRAAYEKGALLTLFSSSLGQSRWVLGLARKPGEEARFIDLDANKDELKKYIPDLFVHSGGWMAGWTVKAPLLCSEKEFRAKRDALVIAADAIMRRVLEKQG